MALVSSFSSLLDSLISLFAFIIISLWFLQSYARLRHVPGPLLASLTNLPRASWVVSNRAHDIHIALHRKYGKLVRFGPNMISVADPAEIANIYGFTGKFPKSDFYHVLLFYAKGKPVPTIFATQDEILHRTLKKPIAGIYSMSNLLSFEPYVDSTISFFFQQLDKLFAETGAVCDLGRWLQMFAFDVMGEITFSKRLGFLETGEDVNGIMGNIWKFFKKTSPITQITWVDRLWTKNPILQRIQTVQANPIVAFAIARAQERQGVSQDIDEKSDLNSRDFLSRFLEALRKDPSIPPFALTAWAVSNITAGSDTTAILLRTIFHNLIIHPSSMSRLLHELNNTPNPLSSPVTWRQSRDLPYLDACIKEAGRLHPPFGLPLERVVPPEGAVICGEFLKGGTVVGISAWVVHRDRETFGEDCDEWRPERWLCEEGRRRKMENALLTFGGGNRTCLGKNISYLEVYKLVPSMLKKYDIKLADPTDKDWLVENRWFVNQTGLNVLFKKRE